MEFLRRRSKLIYLFAIFIVIYLYDSLHISANNPALKHYHLSVLSLALLTLTVVIPYVLIWIVALGGYLSLRNYARSIRQSSDGSSLLWLAYGLFWLVLWLPVNTLLSSLLKHLTAMHPGFTITAQRIDAYVSIVMLAIAYVLMYIWSQRILMTELTKDKKRRPSLARPVFYVVYAALSALYIYLVFRGPVGHGQVVPYLPDSMLLLTVVVPRLLMWFFGLQAIWNLYVYTRYVPGLLYKAAFKYMTIGLGLVTVALVLLGYLSTMHSIANLDLQHILVIVYGLLVIMAGGFVVMMVGARKLQRIEDA